MRKNLNLLLRFIEHMAEKLGGILLFIAALLVTLQIVLRGFGIGISGLYDIATFCALWSVFLTAGVGIQRNIHVRVDIILMVCPPNLAYSLNILSGLITIFISAALIYSGVLLVNESFLFGDTTLGMITIPMWIPQLVMPLGGSLMLLHAIVTFLKMIAMHPLADKQHEN